VFRRARRWWAITRIASMQEAPLHRVFLHPALENAYIPLQLPHYILYQKKKSKYT
jgi:hypothetical protein